MPVPLSYVARNLWTRRLTTALTAGGLALVVFVFATVLMLDAGLKQTLVSTGEYDNVMLVRRSAELDGGVVTARSPGVGKGATFTVTWPRRSDRTGRRGSPAPSRPRTSRFS